MSKAPRAKPKPSFDLRATGRFLVDTMRPRRSHPTVEGHRTNRSGGLELVILLLVLGGGLIAAVLVFGLGR